uniref:BACK domain-containing protein n=1 Tax=Knipowitschia caucasica TaxID=637954 RepID=A0AAV2KDN7_KNICA
MTKHNFPALIGCKIGDGFVVSFGGPRLKKVVNPCSMGRCQFTFLTGCSGETRVCADDKRKSANRSVMSAKAISEQTGKEFLYKYICTEAAIQNKFRFAQVTAETDFDRLAQEHPWLRTEEEEFYVCIYATREGDYVLFHHEGGVDVGDVDAKAKKLLIGVDEKISEESVKKALLTQASNDKKDDTICDLGGVDELANYGEYSGAPSEQQTYDYAKTILSLMTREKHKDAKATTLFSKHTKSIVWGMQTRAVQGMMDFDYVCSRSEPSVAAMVYPFTSVYDDLVARGVIVPAEEMPPPTVPMDYSWARKPNLILNVDGFIGVAFVDLLRTCGGFTRFLLVQLKDFCGEFLKKKLSLTNCVAVHSLAHMYTLDQLALRAADMIRRNFHKVIQDDEFYTLPFHLVRDWLSDAEITVDSEEVLFEAVVKWVQKNSEDRSRYFEELFRLLRLPQIKPTYLTRIVKNEQLVASNEACLKLVSEAVEGHAIRFENLKSADMELWSSHMASFQPRFGQNMDVIMVVGGVSEGGDYLSECVGYFIYEDRWVNLPHIHNHLDGHAIAATETHVYVAGSMEPGFAKTVERYNPNRNTWEQVSNLTTRKHSFGLTCIKDILYSIGGHGNFSPGFKDVSVYEPEQDKWHNLESAPKILRDVKAISVEDRFVYVTARTPVDTDNDDGLKTVTTRYDTDSRQWQDVDSLPLIDNYCIFQMAVASTNFYHTASCCPKSYTVRDEVARLKISARISDEILESLPPEVTSIEGAAICHFDEDVFIIGGWKNSDDVDKQYRKEAYRYCAERKRWMLLPPMPQPRCRATACHVRIPYRFLYGCQRYPMPQNLARQRDRMQQMQQLHRRTLTLRRQLQSQIEC